MNAVEEIISRNKVALMSAVFDFLPKEFARSGFAVEPQSEIVDLEKQVEFNNGEIEIKDMAGAKSGGVAARILGELYVHIKSNNLGRLYTPDTTFAIGANDRMPDVAFVAAERIPANGEPLQKWNFAPDLAVEVVSPTDLVKKVRDRLSEYFAAAVREVWVVEPEIGLLSLYHEPLRPTAIFTRADKLIDSRVLPDLQLALSDIFID